MRYPHNIKGFTVIELISVLSIISIVLFFSIPRLNVFRSSSRSDNIIEKIAVTVKDLKKKAVAERLDYSMHLDSYSGIIWITHEGMEIPDNMPKTHGIRLPDETTVSDVEFPNKKKKRTENVLIRFSKHGYSDMAMIHIQNMEDHITIKIEPFLPDAEIMNGYFSFEDCT